MTMFSHLSGLRDVTHTRDWRIVRLRSHISSTQMLPSPTRTANAYSRHKQLANVCHAGYPSRHQRYA